MAEDRMLNDEIMLGLIKANGGGGGGTSDYSDLSNKPQINNVELSGNKSASDLGIVAAVEGKGLSTNDYNDADKAIVGGVTAALAGKQNALTAGNNIKIDNNTISVNRWAVPAGKVVYTVITSDENYGQNVHVQRHTTGGAFIDDRTFLCEMYKTVNIDSLISIYNPYASFTITLLKNSDEHQSGYSYTVNPLTTPTSNSFTFMMEQEENDNDLIIREELDAVSSAVSAIKDGQSIDSFADVETALAGKADITDLAPAFSTATAYTVGQYVSYDGNIYKCTSAHSAGAWVAGDFTLVAVASELETKQNATDNNLETTSKTVVGAVNELKSGLTNLDNEVNGDATTYPYADVITIEDAVPANLADCNVKIEPVQDLHGYDHPWVGGGYKNLCPYDDITFSVNATWASLTGSSAPNLDDGTSISLKAGTYYISISDSSNIATMQLSLDENVLVNNLQGAFTLETDGTIKIRLKQISSGDQTEGKIQIEIGTYSTSWTPYTNICPISGHTEASVQRDGVNIWDEQWELGGIDDTTGGKASASTQIRSKNYIPCQAETSYYVASPSLGISVYVYFYGSNQNFIGRAFVDDKYSVIRKTITTPENCAYMMLKAGTLTTYNNDISINYPSTNTDYVPYAGKTYTIALGDTIYGGTVDFDSGVMTASWVSKVYEGAAGENWYKYTDLKYQIIDNDYKTIEASVKPNYICNESRIVSDNYFFSVNTACMSFSSDHYMRVNFGTSFADVTEFKTYIASNPLQVCYELATPFTVQLTPQQIQLLKGQNTLTASTGHISVTVNGVSGSIGAVQTQANATDEALAELAAGLTVQTESYTTPISNTYARKYDKIVTISIEYGMPSENLSAGTGVTLGKLPSEYRPTGSDDRYLAVCITGNTGSQLCAARLTVKRDGDVVLMPGSAISSGTHMFLTASYII